MKNRWFGVFLLCLFAIAGLAGQDVRRPAAAGQFYDSDPGRLAAWLKYALDAAETKLPAGDIAALIVPHAGYACSGQIAAQGYRQLKGRSYDAIVVLGPSHHSVFEGCSIYPRGGYETPLGVAAVDERLAADLAKRTRFGFMAAAHEHEHSLEVQIPFLQTVLPDTPIVPVVMGRNTRRNIQTLADGLVGAGAGKKILVVASTDLSHYLSKRRANTVDARTIDLIKGYGLEALFGKCERHENVFCGGGAVVAAMLFAREQGPARVEVLGYADSSETCGPENSVVGYLAAALVVDSPGAAERPRRSGLSNEESEELLKIARRGVEEAVKHTPPNAALSSFPALNEPGAAFVTLTKRGRLRGCVGFTEPVGPLALVVARAAALAALEDPRFSPVKEKELGSLAIEISVLSPLVRAADPKTVQIGRHGLVVCRGERRGLLLPQMAADNGWGREEFLRQACLKAGLPPDDWKKGAEVFIFEAQVIR